MVKKLCILRKVRVYLWRYAYWTDEAIVEFAQSLGYRSGDPYASMSGAHGARARRFVLRHLWRQIVCCWRDNDYCC